MPSKSATREDRRLERLTDICLDLPEAIRERHATHAAFTVRDRKFSYYLDDHHGDGIVALCARAAPGVNDALIASDADRFYKPAYIGPRGWVALRLDVGRVDWDEVAELVIDSYRLVAPKRLVAALDHGPEADGRSSTRRRGAE
ncbi:MAG TPA: MmcQ/YjbR family DNA-binding protein [Acidimicrobiia bacterium]|jgi:phosphoribosylglycinamide formyltransferase-1